MQEVDLPVSPGEQRQELIYSCANKPGINLAGMQVEYLVIILTLPPAGKTLEFQLEYD